jgi:anthranilate synthase component 1
MYSPDLKTFSQLLEHSGLVPVHRTVLADLDTPLTIFAKTAGSQDHAFLFESMEGGEQWGRYSFIGFDPLLTLTSSGKQLTLRPCDAAETVREGVNPLEELKKILAAFHASTAPGLARFYGGLVGFLGYDMVRCIEAIPDQQAPLDLPDSSFMVPRMVLIHDAVEQRLTVVCNVLAEAGKEPDKLYQQARQRIDAVIDQVRSPLPARYYATPASQPHTFTANMEQQQFCDMVEQAKEYILAGDIIQVVLSQRFSSPTDLDPFLLYRSLRHVNPSPYLFYLRLADLCLIGSSPEILVRLEAGEIIVRPIAGTRKRGANPQEDQDLAAELLADPKERAEHLMLVDLGRNDAGRVAASGTVAVQELLKVEKYSHVMHLVSEVHGRLEAGKDQFDVLAACFPAGTVSGAPKIRAMEIIDALEPDKRGPYAGAVGYFGFSGNMDFCIAIRTFVLQGKNLWIQAGAGIVADSIPEKEFEETVNKARALRRAVELAEQGVLL